MNMKKKKINHKNNIETNNELINLIKIVVIVCVILLAFYFITLLVNKKTKGSVFGNDDSVAVIQYDKIIVGEILNRPDNNYLVLVKKENDVLLLQPEAVAQNIQAFVIPVTGGLLK